MSLPAASYSPVTDKPAGSQPVFQFETHAQIIIQALPGQSAQDIAQEVARQLDARERRMKAKARSNFSDQGGTIHDDGPGLFVFQLRTVPYQQLQYQRNWRHVTNNRVNRRPTTQFLGPDNDQLTLSGVLMPEVTGGRLSLLALELMAEQGRRGR